MLFLLNELLFSHMSIRLKQCHPVFSYEFFYSRYVSSSIKYKTHAIDNYVDHSEKLNGSHAFLGSERYWGKLRPRNIRVVEIKTLLNLLGSFQAKRTLRPKHSSTSNLEGKSCLNLPTKSNNKFSSWDNCDCSFAGVTWNQYDSKDEINKPNCK